METTALNWENDLPRSARTGDVYFSPHNGLAESRHVFLSGNNLPEAWQHKEFFTIAEVGFGTGLNFLAAATEFLNTTRDDQHLYYIGLEKYPLSRDQVARALARWRAELPLLDTLLDRWPMRTSGFQFIPLHKRISLLMIHDDAADGLAKLHAPRGIDAWFLDGFTPARDDSAWRDDLYKAITAHSHGATTLATFTAARGVKDGLVKTGFRIKRQKGFAYKWHMLRAWFTQGSTQPDIEKPRNVTILGAGLAGSACANALARMNIACTLVDPDAQLERAASGNPWGAVKPRLTNKPSLRSDYYTAGYTLARQTIPRDLRRDIPALHLTADIDRSAYDWHDDHLFMADKPSAIAGIPVPGSALCFPDALLVQPKELCLHWRGDTPVSLQGESGDILIEATGSHYEGTRPVRGQLTMVKSTDTSAALKAMLFYGGYMAPAILGEHVIGASFERGRSDIDPSDEEDRDNLRKLADAVPALAQDWTIIGHRAAVRANTPDRLPLVGRRDAHTYNVHSYISVGHGSHGLLSAPIAAAIITAELCGLPAPVPRDVLEAVAGDRFTRRS